MQPLTVITTYREGDKVKKVMTQFPTISQMLDYAREEVKWEDTIRVQCKEYDLDLKGDFSKDAGTMTDKQKIELLGEALNNLMQSAEHHIDDKSWLGELLNDIDWAKDLLKQITPKARNI
jgi:hypothetical protein